MNTCHISRRRAVELLLGGLIAQAARAQSAGVDYLKDVEFLLTELESKAGSLLKVKGVQWNDVAEQFRREAGAVKDDVAHIKLCNRLVARLRDGHAGLGDLKVKMPDEAGGRRFTGPRVHLVQIGDRLFVRQAFGSAQEAGVQIGMEVEKVDGVPARQWMEQTIARLRDERGYSTDQMAAYYACHLGLADWEGVVVTLDLSWDDQRKSVALTRSGGPNYVPIGPVFPPKDLQTLGRQSHGRTAAGVGYVHLRDVPGDLPEQLDKILAALSGVKGVILDMRANGGGGCDHEAVFGRFIPTGAQWRQYRGTSPGEPYVGPMVVIVDAGVRSAGETVAGMFKEDGRAFMIGDAPTAGMSSQKAVITVPSGLFTVRFSVASNKGRFNGGRGIEGVGVPPHQITPYDVSDLRAGVDSQIRMAEALLAKGLPKDAVPWEARA